MATHYSILAWEISWTEEPGGLQSMGSQRVRHNISTKTTNSASTGGNKKGQRKTGRKCHTSSGK